MDLEAIEQRTNAATQGPWHYNGRILWGRDEHGRVKAETPADREFTQHARTDVPDLVARARELEEENQKLRALVDDLADDGTCWYDHHGYCQEHGWFATDPRCPHARARDIAKEDTTT